MEKEEKLTLNERKEKGLLSIDEMKGLYYKFTDKVVSDLVWSFRRDLSDEEACGVAGICPDTYYRWVSKSEEFKAMMERAKNNLKIKAKLNIHDSIIQENDVELSKWFLERRQKERYSSRSELSGPDGSKLESGLNELKTIAESMQELTKDDKKEDEQKEDPENKN